MTAPGRRGGLTMNGAIFYRRNEEARATLGRSQMVLTTVGADEGGRRIPRAAYEQSELLDAYDEWLLVERRMLRLERFGGAQHRARPPRTPGRAATPTATRAGRDNEGEG